MLVHFAVKAMRWAMLRLNIWNQGCLFLMPLFFFLSSQLIPSLRTKATFFRDVVMKTLTNKDKINILKFPCYNLKIHDWNAAWCQLCTHHSPKCLRFHPLHEATMILSKFQAFPLKSHLMIVARAPGIHTIVKEWVCIDWDWCWTTYSSKAKLCPQLDIRL